MPLPPLKFFLDGLAHEVSAIFFFVLVFPQHCRDAPERPGRELRTHHVVPSPLAYSRQGMTTVNEDNAAAIRRLKLNDIRDVVKEILVSSILLDKRLKLLEAEMLDLVRQADKHPGDVS